MKYSRIVETYQVENKYLTAVHPWAGVSYEGLCTSWQGLYTQSYKTKVNTSFISITWAPKWKLYCKEIKLPTRRSVKETTTIFQLKQQELHFQYRGTHWTKTKNDNWGLWSLTEDRQVLEGKQNSEQLTSMERVLCDSLACSVGSSAQEQHSHGGRAETP